jgi:hypothetical protein
MGLCGSITDVAESKTTSDTLLQSTSVTMQPNTEDLITAQVNKSSLSLDDKQSIFLANLPVHAGSVDDKEYPMVTITDGH